MVQFTPMVLNVFAFKVNSVDNGAVINAGSLQYIDQFLSYKRNQAFGELNGDLSPVSLPISPIMDPDVSDNPSIKNSLV
ncbi:hypothetical protein [Heyndrickxia acidicola]|uniref:hypothetical protein n=1 Tax=Heyndrickxia acidicola TaxID=209389 RepID=UPI00399C9355